MKYYCEFCQKEFDDNGPYERADGDYWCQNCMEGQIENIERQSERYDKNTNQTQNYKKNNL